MVVHRTRAGLSSIMAMAEWLPMAGHFGKEPAQAVGPAWPLATFWRWLAAMAHFMSSRLEVRHYVSSVRRDAESVVGGRPRLGSSISQYDVATVIIILV